MNDLTLFNLDLDLTLLDDETFAAELVAFAAELVAFAAELVAFAEKLEQQWHELLAEQSTLALYKKRCKPAAIASVRV